MDEALPVSISASRLNLSDALKVAFPLIGDLAELLRYLCIQGNNEEIYKSIIANIFEQELKETTAFVVTEKVGSTSKTDLETKQVYSLKTGSGETRRSDIYIVDKLGRNLHVIEFKSNRHGHFFYARKKLREKPWPENLRKSNYKKILDDVEVLHSQKETYSGARFWICVILYSFNCEKSGYPDKYPRYLKNELEQKSRKTSPIDATEFNRDCEQNRETFVKNLIYLISKEPYACKVEIDRVFVSEIVTGEHRGILVRSDIALMEIVFQ